MDDRARDPGDVAKPGQPPDQRLEEAICGACLRTCWLWPNGSTATGGPLLFDLVAIPQEDSATPEPFLVLHPCCYHDLEADDDDQEDWLDRIDGVREQKAREDFDNWNPHEEI